MATIVITLSDEEGILKLSMECDEEFPSRSEDRTMAQLVALRVCEQLAEMVHKCGGTVTELTIGS